ncbi:MAG: hypothetical protein AB1478_07940 [Nitrospirota bacterium]
MGVFHLSGLGLSPGAVTVPLTYIYFLLKQSKHGDPNSTSFFAYSGEAEEKLKGKPEALIVFTSKEVINGEKQYEVKDILFKIKKQESGCLTIMGYLSKLIKALDLQYETFGDWGLRYFYAIEVDFNNFRDCYQKIHLTLKGIQDKEVECNLIGGSNQINISLMLASSMTGIASRLYYVFETNTSMMHPASITSRNQIVPVPPPNWHEVPPFFVSMGDLIRELDSLGITNKPVNIGQIKSILKGLNFSEQFIAKLRGTWLIIKDDRVEAGPLLKHILDLHDHLEKESIEIGNFSKWKNYFTEKGWLYKVIEDSKMY